jgi:hypothetical protein
MKITIEGKQGEGKTSMARFIAEAASKIGYQVEVTDTDGDIESFSAGPRTESWVPRRGDHGRGEAAALCIVVGPAAPRAGVLSTTITGSSDDIVDLNP